MRGQVGDGVSLTEVSSVARASLIDSTCHSVGDIGARTSELSGIIGRALNLGDHGESLSGADTAFAAAVAGLAEAVALAEVESARSEELRARAVAIVQNCACAIGGEVKGSAVAELRDCVIALGNAVLSWDLSQDKLWCNTASEVGGIS